MSKLKPKCKVGDKILVASLDYNYICRVCKIEKTKIRGREFNYYVVDKAWNTDKKAR